MFAIPHAVLLFVTFRLKVYKGRRRERNKTQLYPEILSVVVTMAEVAGLVLSALTVGPVFSQGATIALELYRAPKDIERLRVSSHVTACRVESTELVQEHLERLRKIILPLTAPAGNPEQTISSQALSKICYTIEELHRLIVTKLIKQPGTGGGIRRKAWIKHRKMISKLRRDLKSALEILGIAVSAETLSVVNCFPVTASSTDVAVQIRDSRRFIHRDYTYPRFGRRSGNER